jgi:hypothetical protein
METLYEKGLTRLVQSRRGVCISSAIAIWPMVAINPHCVSASLRLVIACNFKDILNIPAEAVTSCQAYRMRWQMSLLLTFGEYIDWPLHASLSVRAPSIWMSSNPTTNTDSTLM